MWASLPCWRVGGAYYCRTSLPKKGRFWAAPRPRENSPTTPISHAGPCTKSWYVSIRYVGGAWRGLCVVRTWVRLRGGCAQVAGSAVRAHRARTVDLDSSSHSTWISASPQLLEAHTASPSVLDDTPQGWPSNGIALVLGRCLCGSPGGGGVGGLKRPLWPQGNYTKRVFRNTWVARGPRHHNSSLPTPLAKPPSPSSPPSSSPSSSSSNSCRHTWSCL